MIHFGWQLCWHCHMSLCWMLFCWMSDHPGGPLSVSRNYNIFKYQSLIVFLIGEVSLFTWRLSPIISVFSCSHNGAWQHNTTVKSMIHFGWQLCWHCHMSLCWMLLCWISDHSGGCLSISRNFNILKYQPLNCFIDRRSSFVCYEVISYIIRFVLFTQWHLITQHNCQEHDSVYLTVLLALPRVIMLNVVLMNVKSPMWSFYFPQL